MQPHERRRMIGAGTFKACLSKGDHSVSNRSNRKLVALAAAIAVLVIAGWLDTVVVVGIQRRYEQTFDISLFAWALSIGYLIVAAAVLAIALLARWAKSVLVGLVYAVVGAFLVLLFPMIWLGAVGLNGAPPFLPEPIATLVNDAYLYGEQGPLNAVAIIGAGMLIVGIVSIAYAFRHRASATPVGVEGPLPSEATPS